MHRELSAALLYPLRGTRRLASSIWGPEQRGPVRTEPIVRRERVLGTLGIGKALQGVVNQALAHCSTITPSNPAYQRTKPRGVKRRAGRRTRIGYC